MFLRSFEFFVFVLMPLISIPKEQPKIQQVDSVSYWLYGSDTVHQLYCQNELTQNLYYKNGVLASFWIYDRYNNVATCGDVSMNDVDSNISCFIVQVSSTKDFKLTIWKPVRMNYQYSAKVYYEDQVIDSINFSNNPTPRLSLPNHTKGVHNYYFEYTIYQNQSIVFGPYKWRCLRLVEGKIDHGY